MRRPAAIVLMLLVGAIALGLWLGPCRSATIWLEQPASVVAPRHGVGTAAKALPPAEGGASSAELATLRVRCVAGGARVPGVGVSVLQQAADEWASVRSGETGQEGEEAWELPAGTYAVVAESASLARRVVEVRLARGEVRSVELVMTAGHAIDGVVVDERTREPIVGAAVRVRGDSSAPASIASTDVRGRFRLVGLPPGRAVLDIAAPGFAARAVLARTPDLSTLMIALTSAAWLSGRVVGGRPGDTIRVIAVGAADGDVREVTAAPTGAFSLEVPTGRYAVTARSMASVSNVVSATVLPGETAQGIELRLGPGAWIRGNVRRGDTRRAIAGATVVVSVVERDAVVLQSTSAADGTFEIGPLSGGAYDVSAHLGGYRPVVVRALEVPPGAAIVKDLFVDPGASLAVGVRRDDGKPVVGARVSLAYSGFVPDSSLPRGQADEAGEVVLAGLPAGALVLLVQLADQVLTMREPVQIPPSGLLRRVVTVPGGSALLRGQVTGGARPLGPGPIVVKFRRDSPATWGEQVTDADGRFALELPLGVWRLSAAQGDRKASAATVDLTKALDPIELPLQDPPARPLACVRDPAGKPVPGARVFYRASSVRGMTTTDGTGCAQLGPFDEPEVAVSAELESMRGTSTLRSNQDVALVLQPGGVVTGSVVGEVPVRSFELVLPTDPDMQPSGVSRTIVGDQFAVDAPSGSWLISAKSDDGREAKTQVEVRPGQETHVQLRFGRAPPTEVGRTP